MRNSVSSTASVVWQLLAISSAPPICVTICSSCRIWECKPQATSIRCCAAAISSSNKSSGTAVSDFAARSSSAGEMSDSAVMYNSVRLQVAKSTAPDTPDSCTSAVRNAFACFVENASASRTAISAECTSSPAMNNRIFSLPFRSV